MAIVCDQNAVVGNGEIQERCEHGKSTIGHCGKNNRALEEAEKARERSLTMNRDDYLEIFFGIGYIFLFFCFVFIFTRASCTMLGFR